MNEKNNITKVINIFEAFAGIGSQRKALENIKINYKVVGMAEWYVPAIVSYQAIHNGLSYKNLLHGVSNKKMMNFLKTKTLSINSKNQVSKNYWNRLKNRQLKIIYSAVKKSEQEGNIFDVNNLYSRGLNDIDLLTYSFPCQDLSQQGNQKGMKKGAGTRSGLLWQIEKALDHTEKKSLPKYLLMENVVALSHSKNKKDLNKWINKLKKLGYKNSIGILNAAHFGSPQARRRVFMISSLLGEIDLPIGNKNSSSIKSILNKKVIQSDYLYELEKYDFEKFKLTKSNINKTKLIGYTTFNSESYVYDPNFTGPTLTASGANSRIKILHKDRIRKLNAKEAYQYMGFDKEDYLKVNKLNILNEIKMIYTCGNSISVEVLESIFKEMLCKKNTNTY